ncbi:uncharacterized protein TNCV_3182571 [Trichonephila clavipes]|uniref:Uncharacterized protein n=1 Tax=Trichonephila clavipes TaxID=2585209 RepID=A0A8X6SHQ7_TRICX|nr:uncharacterized protein TNCV_3182571 [Trichonephila clavipes]
MVRKQTKPEPEDEEPEPILPEYPKIPTRPPKPDGDRFNSCQVIYSQFGLAIHQNDHRARRRFVEWAQNEIAVVPDFHKRILFSDEAHFWLNGYVNKQNCRIWSRANPQVYVETPLDPEKLTVCCALWASGIIGPYFFKNDEGHNELWFQQDGATCHTAHATIYLLKDTFGDRLNSRFEPVNWPPRSCDLTPLDYFLWGYVISLVYADKPQTLDHLENNIRRVIPDIRPQSSKIGRPDWTTSEPAVAVLCQKSYLKYDEDESLEDEDESPEEESPEKESPEEEYPEEDESKEKPKRDRGRGGPGRRPGKPGRRLGKPGRRPGKPGRPGRPGKRPGRPDEKQHFQGSHLNHATMSRVANALCSDVREHSEKYATSTLNILQLNINLTQRKIDELSCLLHYNRFTRKCYL